jgi:hypothetical protein
MSMKRIFALAALTALLALPALADQYRDPADLSVVSPGTVMETAPARGGVPNPVSPTNPLPTGPSAITITQTIVTLTAATSATLIAANANRRYLCWMNTGTAPMTVAPGAVTVVAGTGMNYDPGSSASNQGGSFCQDGVTVSQQAFSAISTAGTKVTVWEGQ